MAGAKPDRSFDPTSARGDTNVASGQFDFSGKTVLVVDASRAGIDAAIADGFAATVAISGKEDVSIESYQGRYAYHQLDVADEAAVQKLGAATPKLDILINCAGMANSEIEWSNAGFKRVIDVNLVGMLNLANAFKPHLTETKGAVVAIASCIR